MGRGGMDTDASVPLPFGTGPILNVPFKSAARSFMPSNPIERVLEISACEIPRPLSLTSKIIRPAASFKWTATCVAPAWRIMFVRVSWKMRKKVVAMSGVKIGSCKSVRTSHLIPVRVWNSFACHSSAAIRPRWSRIPGLNSVAMRRTVWIVASICAERALAFSFSSGR